MYLDSIAFKAMESGINQMKIKQEVHSQNISNIDTPDYNYKTVSFENTLKDAADRGKKKYSFKTDLSEIYETDVRVDGSNVDTEKESLELYSAYIQQSAIINQYNSAVNRLRYTLTNSNFK